MESRRKVIRFLKMDERQYVLDANAIICILRAELGKDKVEEVLLDALLGLCKVYLHKITLLEIYYDILRSEGKDEADLIFEIIKDFSIIVIDNLTDDFLKKAGSFKPVFKTSFADLFVLALAATHNATVITSDHHEMDIVEKSGLIKFLWIR